MKMKLEGWRHVAGKDARGQIMPCHRREFRNDFVLNGDLLKGFKQWSNVVRYTLQKDNSAGNQSDVSQPKSDVLLLVTSFHDVKWLSEKKSQISPMSQEKWSPVNFPMSAAPVLCSAVLLPSCAWVPLPGSAWNTLPTYIQELTS